ncbi:MAG TPA: hypothetical protein VF882_03700 [Gemmatimonadales bacterium]
MPKRVFLATTDLLFRSKLAGVVGAGGAETTRDEAACDLAVIELGDAGAPDRIRGLVARGVPVVAYGSHVRADLLRAARAAGAVAVPNSEVEKRLLELLGV